MLAFNLIKKFKKISLVVFILITASVSNADRILVEEDGQWVATDAATTRAKPQYKSQLDKQVGLGLMVGGPLAIGGAVLEINLFPQWTFSVGLGGSNQFTSFFAQAKKMLKTGSWSPYIGAGIARWQRSSQTRFDYNDVLPGFVSNKLVSDSDKSKGIISETLVYPTLGIQFSPFHDIELETSSFFVEAIMLADFDDFQIVPSGSAGWVYYF